MNEKTKNILRWIGVLPVAILASCVAYFLSNLFNTGTLYAYCGHNIFAEICGEILASAISVSAFLLAGSRMAPNHRKITTYVLSGIICLFCVISFICTFYVKTEWNSYVGIIVSIVVSVLIALEYREDDSK